MKIIKIALIFFFSLVSIFNGHAQQKATPNDPEAVSEALDYLHLAKSFYTKSVDKALNYSQLALEKAKQTNNDSLKAHCYKAFGTANYYAGQSAISIPAYDTALAYFKQLNDTNEIGNVYNNLGISRSAVGDYNGAIEMYLAALQIRKSTNNTAALGSLYNNLGSLYYQLEDHTEALRYFQDAFELSVEQGDSIVMMSTKNNIGLVQLVTQNYKEALLSFRESIEIGKRNNDSGGIANSMHNIAMIHFFKKNIDSALYYYQEAEKLYQHIGLRSGNNFLGLGNCYYEKGAYQKALKAFKEALAISYETNSRTLRLDAYRNLFETYKTTNNRDAAFEAVQQYHVLFDSVKTLFDSTAVKNIQARFEVNNKIRELETLKEQQQIQLDLLNEQQQKLKFQRILSYVSLLFLAIVLLFVYFLFNLLKKNKRTMNILRHKNDELEKARLALTSSHKSLREQEELLRTLINSTPDIICFKDGKGRWVEANQSDLEVFNLTGVDYKMKTDEELAVYSPMHKDAFENCMISDEIAWQKGKIIRQDEDITDQEGNTKTYDVYKIPLLHPDGSRKGLIVWGRDISDRKQTEKQLKRALEKAEESDRLKTAFLSNMSHEIRTPLNAIIGFSDLLEDEDLTSVEKSQFIRLIHQNGDALLSLIGDIIDLARVEAGETKINLQPTNLNDLFNELNASYKTILQQRKKSHLDWKINIPDFQVVIPADSQKLRQVIVNLLDNALKFTETGSIDFGFVPFKNKYGKIEEVEFFVKDTGIGIPADQQRKIFNRFTKLNDSGKKIYPGTGLGLSIVQHYIQLMGGSVRLESETGNGSTFSINLPLFNQAKHAVMMQSNHLANQYNFNGKNILIVEDVDSNFELLAIILMPTKSKIIRAGNGLEAVEICKDNLNIDLVLMDIQLPVLNGLDATMRIKKFRPELPIIAQTAFAMSEEKEACFVAGCNAYIAKPIRAELMLPVLSELLFQSNPKS